MANIVQFYKAQFSVNGASFPMQPGSANLQWDKNYDIPMMTGNFSQQVYAEGFQMPTIDVTYVLIDNNAACPIIPGAIDYFLNRNSDYSNDLSTSLALKYFDGFSGRSLPWAKGGAFSIGGSKDSSVRFSSSFACYVPAGATLPAVLTTNPFSYTAFHGTPIRFEKCSFFANGSGLDGVMSWDISFSNNLSPDMSNVSDDDAAPSGQAQQFFPIDVNAGTPTASLRLAFQANSTQHIFSGDSFEVHIEGSNVNLGLKCNSLVVRDPDSRSLSTNRQMRVYNCTVLAPDNTTSPVSRV